jgi:nitroimidazol reductase NimA-like FMN-containing flavoprotein (pyridoxamine 5'-phosphate oxidase superfamily)
MAVENASLRTERTTLKRAPDRGAHDFETIAAILDEGFVCHLGFVADGQPYVIPTGYGRDGHDLYVHGSAASRMLRNLSSGVSVCLTVTLVDGLVYARSVFHQSINYRSVVVIGTAELLETQEDKLYGLEVIVGHITPGRWNDARRPSSQELKATSVLRLPIDEASAKVRAHGAKDEPEDLSLPVWAGVLPLTLAPGEPEPEADLARSIPTPEYVRSYRRRPHNDL